MIAALSYFQTTSLGCFIGAVIVAVLSAVVLAIGMLRNYIINRQLDKEFKDAPEKAI